jgi:hypothetical protein
VLGGKVLRLACAGPVVVAVAIGCSSATGERPGHSSSGGARGQPAPVFTMANGSFSVAQIPPGFRAWRDPRHEEGPIPGTSYDAQDFLNDSAKQKFTISVHRRMSVALFTDPTQTLHPVRSDRDVHGRATYVASNDISLQREVIWVVDPTTLAYVIGNNLTDADLFAVAEAVQVSEQD